MTFIPNTFFRYYKNLFAKILIGIAMLVLITNCHRDEHWDYPDPRCKLAPEMKTNLIYQ
jgi:hypothetical protein